MNEIYHNISDYISQNLTYLKFKLLIWTLNFRSVYIQVNHSKNPKTFLKLLHTIKKCFNDAMALLSKLQRKSDLSEV